MKRAWIAAAAALLVFSARPARAQRDLLGMGGPSVGEARRHFLAESREKVGALLADYESAWGSHDLRALMRLYGPSAIVYPAAGGMLTGADALRDYFRRVLPTVEPVRTQIVEFKASGDLAVATVQVQYGAPGQQAPAAGTDVFVLHRDWSGTWSIVSHLSRPEAVAAAPASAPARATAADSVNQP